ncbi:MFS transporter [Thermotalea metallivorans]|uniref:Multidrug resistance protein MdtH n=1 Tax=Thermotalea metallivorans TaxID=520762 RepID=A0A140LCF7_9FIRM|nr:MFS transporter [Thermotalea metallivorans]KXG78232.1 Multidrug resistance protein MdtH [Thermotalea metallivorans]
MKRLGSFLSTFLNKNYDKNLLATLISRVLAALGYTMIMPFLAVMLAKYHDLSTTQVALIVGTYAFSQTGLMIPAAFIVNKIGYKLSMIIGRILGGVLYVLFLYISNVNLLILISIAVGLGSSMFNLACKGFISLETASDEQKKLHAFALYNMSLNLGGALGPLIGALFMDKDYLAFLLYIVAALNILSAIIIDRMVVFKLNRNPENTIKSSLKGFVAVLKNKKFLFYFILTVMIHLSFSQFFSVLPLYFSKNNVSMSVYSIMLTINTIMAVFLQVPLMYIVNKKLKHNSMLGLGLGSLLIGFSIFMVFINTNLVILLIIAIVFTIGELVFTPFEDKAISDVIDNSEYTAAYFGFASFGWSLSKGLGNYIGIKMLSVFNKYSFSMFVSSFSFIVFMVVLLIWLIKPNKITLLSEKNNIVEEHS